MKKIKINKYLGEVYMCDIFDKPIEQTIEFLKEVQKKYTGQFDTIELAESDGDISVIGSRFETDAEQEKRIRKEQSLQNRQEDEERELYEKLKRKFGPK